MGNNQDGYYDIPVDMKDILVDNGLVEELFYIKDLEQRKLFLNAIITAESVGDAARHIMQFNREDAEIPVGERKPIILYITSDGGDVDAGFALIDLIMNSKTPVYTVNLAYQYSMALLIGLAGHKRFTNPHAKFLLHDGSTMVYNSTGKAQDAMIFQSRIEQQTKEYVLARTGLTEEEYDAKQRVEWYMFADEAKEKGFVDYIIGVDCEIDAIV